MIRTPGKNSIIDESPAIGPLINVPIIQAMLKTGPGKSEIIENADRTSISRINCCKENSVRMNGRIEAPPPIKIVPILKNLSIKKKFIEKK